MFRERSRAGAFAATPIYAASKAAINMMTVQFASPFVGRDGTVPW